MRYVAYSLKAGSFIYNKEMTKTELQQDIQQKIFFLNERELKALQNVLDVLLDSDKKPDATEKQTRGLIGCMPGLVEYISDDFNEPLEDFKDYMPE